ncbi:superoxide dismutase family protein [Salinimonas sediminis]|uniref:Superoxide dismutase n=1 Tax=Salinimonas sediminis TaxID=2303538 RepID=A0A346NIA3_9ALTE|nr:superoxide dismutase family protein [Salinimonas sediminis]AXR05260.1 superoxide dismutase [Salinimonas sediminis]
MGKILTGLSATLLALSTQYAVADSIKVDMKNVKSNESAGSVLIEEHEDGLVFKPSVDGLTPGGHGFHVHENGSCDSAMKDGEKVPAGAAGSHLDPDKTGSHGYPWDGQNHIGDLPLLYVSEDGQATHPVLATRLALEDVEGKALMVHEGGDNYSDSPEKLGGGGPRVLCGVIKAQ